MHLADAFIQSDLQCIQAIHLYCQCALCGIYDATFIRYAFIIIQSRDQNLWKSTAAGNNIIWGNWSILLFVFTKGNSGKHIWLYHEKTCLIHEHWIKNCLLLVRNVGCVYICIYIYIYIYVCVYYNRYYYNDVSYHTVLPLEGSVT